jgi:hypothetical protein
MYYLEVLSVHWLMYNKTTIVAMYSRGFQLLFSFSSYSGAYFSYYIVVTILRGFGDVTLHYNTDRTVFFLIFLFFLKLRQFVEESVRLCRPSDVYVCDGSEAENSMLIDRLLENRTIVALPKYKNW